MTSTTDVLIVGGGPVGLTLAIALGKAGVRCTLIEQKEAPALLPKMERCNARTMEMYRRLGIAESVRAAGLKADVPMDVFVVLSMTEKPLIHHPYPSVAQAREQIKATNDGTMPLEPYQLISQYTLEPLLKSIAEELPSVTVHYGHEFLSFAQDDQGVTAQVTAGGKTVSMRAQYLIGCDGGSSTVRKQLGIKLRGEFNLLELRQALYRCDELFDKIPIGPGPGHGRHYHVADAPGNFLIMQDSTKHWTLHAVSPSDEDMKRQFEAVVGVPVKYEMLTCAPWRHNLMLSERYGEGRVFLAGDAVHLVIPTGGLGMNSGVGDAVDLAWKLAATLQGWGGPHLLRSYEFERRQIGDRNVGASRYASMGRRSWRKLYKPDIRQNAETRDTLIRAAEVEQRKSNEMLGAELGYRYIDSPIISDIPGGPEHRFMEYTPSTWPGARLPHVWLEDSTAMQDRIGEGYTILRLGRSTADLRSLEREISKFGAPVEMIDIPDATARDVYGYDILLLRPDMHIVWRGNSPPEDATVLAKLTTGH